MRLSSFQLVALLGAGSLLASIPALAKDSNAGGPQAQGQAIVTVLSGKEIPGNIPQQALHVKVNGKDSEVTGWTQLNSRTNPIEVVILVDNGARSSIGLQLKDIANFIQSLPPNAKVAVAYMQSGEALLSGPLSADHAAVIRELHLPLTEVAANASPYICLSDLANRWPSKDTGARREVVMVTDGVDYYDPGFDLQDPYLQAAIEDSVRAHLVVYSIYWRNQGRFDRTGYATFSGQELLAELTGATGGNDYWEGYGNPVSFAPYLDDISRRIHNQYELSFTSPVKGKPQMASFKLKLSAPGKLEAPQEVFVRSGGE